MFVKIAASKVHSGHEAVGYMVCRSIIFTFVFAVLSSLLEIFEVTVTNVLNFCFYT